MIYCPRWPWLFGWWDGDLYGPNVLGGILSGFVAWIIAWWVSRQEIKKAEGDRRHADAAAEETRKLEAKNANEDLKRAEKQRKEHLLSESKNELYRKVASRFTLACFEYQDALGGFPESESEDAVDAHISYVDSMRTRADHRAVVLMMVLAPEKGETGSRAYIWFRDHWNGFLDQMNKDDMVDRGNDENLARLSRRRADLAAILSVCVKWETLPVSEWRDEEPPYEIYRRLDRRASQEEGQAGSS
ncbi:hypothetical protein [Nocardiopsis aegyptia]|uniref:DUF4760 domain-containing protein n=1 Tax=Nocardiopsis aegyptia TaxID=220378 RepID=A0A7Z0EPL2_9ACTN|nr:hypothetical protein [Nocardiopsis aegyptia]NYJ35921.1 hypothetical protein [Nocardiopsis aegyptia]